MNSNLTELAHWEYLIQHYLIPFSLKIIGAFAFWIVAGLIIRVAKRVLGKALQAKRVDPTLILYANQTLSVALKLLTLVAILNLFGIETTSFSAILAAAGVAIGVAWSGLLSNFAAGIFLIMFRPFKAGDTIQAGGVTGVVREIGLFATTIDNPDNLRLFVGNNKLFTDTILNFSKNPYRLAGFRIQLAHNVQPMEAIALFSSELQGLDGVRSDPPVSGEILEFNPMGTVISIKAACHQSAYSSVMAKGNELIHQLTRKASYPVPEARATLNLNG
jgi:small conductance mechanosensitive channel